MKIASMEEEKIPLGKMQLLQARETIERYLEPTPVLRSQSLNALAGCELFFKAENFQKTGSFKARGATYALQQLDPESASPSVITHSSGNHGQALAWAAREQGLQAQIVMPEDAPKSKVAAVRGYGGVLHFCPPNLPARESTMEELRLKSGATFIPPYDHWDIIAGQSTCAQELLWQVDALEALVTPVGGGGLLAGTLLAAKYFSSGLATYAGEPAGADDAYRSIRSGQRVTEHQPQTIADGLRTTLGQRNFRVILQRVADIFCVEDKAIIGAMRLIYQRLKLVVEPSCAVPLAAVLAQPELFSGKRVGIILTGGNVDLRQLPF